MQSQSCSVIHAFGIDIYLMILLISVMGTDHSTAAEIINTITMITVILGSYIFTDTCEPLYT